MRIAIIGAGAAGCFAAANIPPAPGLEVTVFEKSAKALQKVKVSGGGRCNVTHACFDVSELITRYPRGKQLLKKTLYSFPPQSTINWFEQRGVKLKTEEDGRMFPASDNSQTIIDCIWQQMMRNGVGVIYHKTVSGITHAPGRAFTISFSDGSTFQAERILIATGGFPKAEQYHWIEALGHTIVPPVPSLFTFNIPGDPITGLMGVSVPDAVVKISGTKIMQSGPLLITHWGMSGPAVLRASAVAARELAGIDYKFRAVISWLGHISDNDLKLTLQQTRSSAGGQLVYHRNPFSLPRRLWEFLLEKSGIAGSVRWGDLPGREQNRLIENLLRDAYQVRGKTTFKEEFVTSGGISLAEVDPQTMESRKVPGLFFAGEILDVDGITGGYNFQHAWSSGWIAARNMTE